MRGEELRYVSYSVSMCLSLASRRASFMNLVSVKMITSGVCICSSACSSVRTVVYPMTFQLSTLKELGAASGSLAGEVVCLLGGASWLNLCRTRCVGTACFCGKGWMTLQVCFLHGRCGLG